MGLREETRLRVDEIDDLVKTQPDNWEAMIRDRTQLVRQLLDGALATIEPMAGDQPIIHDGSPAGEPSTGTGQDLASYLPDWDLPDDEAMARNGATQLMVWSVKEALRRGGLTLKYPGPGNPLGWRVYPAGFPVPADWAGR